MWEKGGASENDMPLPTGLAFKSPTGSFNGASFFKAVQGNWWGVIFRPSTAFFSFVLVERLLTRRHDIVSW